ncbi:MAG: GNAT family N-acetyltransferase [Hyphomicrobiaceae bacterium]
MAISENSQDTRANTQAPTLKPAKPRDGRKASVSLRGKFDTDRSGTGKSNIYRQVRKNFFPATGMHRFHVIDSPVAFIRHAGSFAKFQGLGAIKQFAKSFSRRRPCYIVLDHGHVVSFGTLSIGFCKDYAVEGDAVVIGTVWTIEAMRGKGLATLAIQEAMNYMIARGRYTFYIDTGVINKPMLRSIEKLGFGEPSGTFVVVG